MGAPQLWGDIMLPITPEWVDACSYNAHPRWVVVLPGMSLLLNSRGYILCGNILPFKTLNIAAEEVCHGAATRGVVVERFGTWYTQVCIKFVRISF
jgi:hypothetical protein